MRIRRLTPIIIGITFIGIGLLLPTVFKPSLEGRKNVVAAEHDHHADTTTWDKEARGPVGPKRYSQSVAVPVTEDMCVADPIEKQPVEGKPADSPAYQDAGAHWKLTDGHPVSGAPFSYKRIGAAAKNLVREQNPLIKEVNIFVPAYGQGCKPGIKLPVEVFWHD